MSFVHFDRIMVHFRVQALAFQAWTVVFPIAGARATAPLLQSARKGVMSKVKLNKCYFIFLIPQGWQSIFFPWNV